MTFEELLLKNKYAVERYVHFKISNFQDAEDVIQETYLAAFRKYGSLTDETHFKPWIIRIAKNKCIDYYRGKAAAAETTDQDPALIPCGQSLFGRTEASDVADTMAKLRENDRQILRLCYFEDCFQAEIAEQLRIPAGTVKSRLHYAKQRFKAMYPHQEKGVHMNKLPTILPAYEITSSDSPPFAAEWQELMGWFLVPKPGERITWAAYDLPERKQTQLVEMAVTGEAEVHGIRGVAITAKEYVPAAGGGPAMERHFVAQLTDTHCRFLAERHQEGGVAKYHTFLDDEEFTRAWGFGEDNCGKETRLVQRQRIQRNGSTVMTDGGRSCVDVVGRYTVKLGGKAYDTVCVMDIESCGAGVVTEQYIDQNGRTVLWRRFNADDWQLERYRQKWSDRLPDNARITVNGKTYIHWYDCISDYIG